MRASLMLIVAASLLGAGMAACVNRSELGYPDGSATSGQPNPTAGVPAPITGGSTITIAANPTSVTADSNTLVALTVKVLDASLKPVANTAVNLSGDGTQNFFSLVDGVTDASGTLTATLHSPFAQNENVIATGSSFSAHTLVTFNAGAPATSTSLFTAVPSSLAADGSSLTVLKFIVEDAQGNPVPNAAATFTSDGTGNAFPLGFSGTTNSAGVFSASMSSTKGQVKTITAQCGGASKATTVTFGAGAPNSTLSSIVATPTTVVADNTSQSTIVVTLKDAFGNSVPNWTFTLSAMNTASPQLSRSAVTNGSGIFTFALTSPFAGTKEVFARTGAVRLVGAVNFTQPTPYCGTTSSGAFYALPPMWYGASSSTHTLTTVDLNNDGFTDIVETDPGSNKVVIGLGLGNGRFGPSVSYPVGNNPTMAATCNLNADAFADVVVANANDGTFTAFTGSSTGALTVTPSSPVTVSGVNMVHGSIQCADITNDGLADVVVGSFANPKRFYYFSGDGSGGFGSATTQNETSPPYSFVIGDVNGDSNQDIVFVDDANHVEINISEGAGTFAATVGKNVGLGTNPIAVALADLDAKNGLDIVTMNSGTSNASVLLNNGSGVFATSNFVTINASQPGSLWLADLNADGNVEIIAGSVNDDNITITRGLGNALFAPPIAYPVGSAPTDIVAARVDGGTTLDLIVAIGGNDTGGAQVMFGNGDGTVKDYAVYAAGNNPSGLAAGDLNGDGFADLVVTAGSEIDVFLNSGAGGVFNAFAPYTTAINGQSPVSVSLVDLDSDGDLDVVASLTGTSGGMITMFNAGNGTFTGGVEYATPGGVCWGAGVADFNNDGHPDVAAGYRNGGNIWVALGSATGVLRAPYSVNVGTSASNPAELSVGDVNADGNQDVIVALYNDDKVGVLLGVGDGNFVNHGSYASTGSSTLGGVVLADLNLDGKTDLAVTETIGFSTGTLLGDGTGTFAAQWNAHEDFPYALTAADVNGDGVPDTVVGVHYRNSLDVHLGNGDGNMGSAITYAAGHGPYYVVVADFDHDGHMDIANVDQADNTLSVRLWSGCP